MQIRHYVSLLAPKRHARGGGVANDEDKSILVGTWHTSAPPVERATFAAPASKLCAASSHAGICGHLPGTDIIRPPAGCHDWPLADASTAIAA
jgi:hypothetical protein